MAETKRTPVPRPQRQFAVEWGNDLTVEQVYVDEMMCQLVDERAYVTFGQARFPLQPAADEQTPLVEIRPVIRLIITQEKLRKIADLFNTLVDKHNSEKK